MLAEAEVRQEVYRWTVERGRPPRVAELARALGRPPGEVAAAFAALREKRLLWLAPESGEIVMAPPFSAVPTPFRVATTGGSWFANCVWDAYGIPAALRADARVEASCACCGEPMALEVAGGAPVPAPGIAHFAVPAAHWWDDLPYT